MPNDITPHYYRVTIAGASLTGTGAAGGFIDNVKLQSYVNASAFPASAGTAQAKALGNYRYDTLMSLLSENQAPMVTSVVNGSATVNAVGSSLAFTVAYERPEYIYTYNEVYGVPAASTSAIQVLTTAAAIKRQVARVFTGSRTTKLFSYAGTSAGWTTENTLVGTPVSGTLSSIIDVVEGNITVTRIANT